MTAPTMRAARIHAFGGPETLVVEDAPRPEPGPRDVLVEVHATSINPIDFKTRGGYNRAVMGKRFPRILGMDVSGVVVAVGAEVDRFAVGDEVWSSPSHKRPGTYAELVAIDQAEVARKPANLTHVEAASIPLVGLTTWGCFVTKGKLQAGEKVFVQAGSGGVGTFAIQLAKHMGAIVSTSCSTRNVGLVTELGADVVVDYTKDAYEEVLEPQDLVLECLGGEHEKRGMRLLRRGGRMVSINAGMVPRVKRWGPYFGVACVGVHMGVTKISARIMRNQAFKPVIRTASGEDLGKIGDIVEQGAIRAVVDRVFALEDIADAHRYSETGRARGKIVVAVHPSALPQA